MDGAGPVAVAGLGFTHGGDHHWAFVPSHARVKGRCVGGHDLKAGHEGAIDVGAPECVEFGLAGQAVHGMGSHGQGHVIALQVSA